MKKFIAACAAALYISSRLGVYAADSGADITGRSRLYLNGMTAPAVITDGRYTTKINISQGDKLEISASENINAVYMVFDRPVQPYTLTSGGKEQACGKSGFIHEYIKTEVPSEDVEITLPRGILCDIYILSNGQTPDYIQQWQEPYRDCDMLLLPTHADDEHLYFGPAMAIYADKGYRLQVAYLNNHWGEPYRPHEALNGLWTAGIRAYPIIPEFNDMYAASLEQAEKIYDSRRILAYQVELIRRFKPEVIIGHDINGEYGHGTHILNTHCLMQALEMSGDETCFPDSAQKYGVFNVPKTYIHLYKENSITLDADSPLSSFGGKTAYEVACRAFEKHASQQQWFSVEKSGPYDCRQFGLYKTLVGADSGAADMFENISEFSDRPEPDDIRSNSVPLPQPDKAGKGTDVLPVAASAAALALIITILKGIIRNGTRKA